MTWDTAGAAALGERLDRVEAHVQEDRKAMERRLLDAIRGGAPEAEAPPTPEAPK